MLLSKRHQDSHTSKANDEAITGHVSAPDVDGCGHQSSASWNSHSYPDVYIQCRARSSACHKAVLASPVGSLGILVLHRSSGHETIGWYLRRVDDVFRQSRGPCLLASNHDSFSSEIRPRRASCPRARLCRRLSRHRPGCEQRRGPARS